MSRKLDLKVPFDTDLDRYLAKNHPKVGEYRIRSRALDARGANRGKKPKFNYSIEYDFGQEEQIDFPQLGELKERPIIVGTGPAGLFCALRLSEYGISSILIERGDSAAIRMKKIAHFWRYGEFDGESNVCFGEGGAGLFSDGKLITRVKSPYIKYVMRKLVDFGAPPETEYRNDPHLGSNKIRELIPKITGLLKERGCDIRYNSRMEKLILSDGEVVGLELASGEKIYSSRVVVATGHSARDVYRMFDAQKIPLSPKSFAVGVRIEHPRELINRLQYGPYWEHPALETAKYRLSYHKGERGTYSFCMCPGGYVLSAGTESDGLVTNGMSNFSRNAPWSNSALVVSVKSGEDFEGNLGGIEFQREIEKRAYELSKEKASGRELPAQPLLDFIKGKSGQSLPKTSTPSKAFYQPIEAILPSFVCDRLREAMTDFDRKIPGYLDENAVLYAPETRTSAPVSVVRDKESLQSLSGLYPCGEGAGCAGGITSAAVDGIKVAMKIIEAEKDYKL